MPLLETSVVAIRILESLAEDPETIQKYNDYARKNQIMISTMQDIVKKDVRVIAVTDELWFSFAKDLNKMKHLEEISLVDCSISELPISFRFPINLTKISFIDCGFTHLPSSITFLTQVTILVLDHNQLEELPILKDMDKLQILSVIDNNLVEVGSLPKSLRVLDVSDNDIVEIDPEISELENLECLSFADNHLSNLPLSLKRLNKLNTFHINNNHFESFPPVLLKMKGISHLSIYENPIKDIPSALLRLPSLNYLLYADCGIKKVPKMIENSNLLTLDLSMNPQIRKFYFPNNLQHLFLEACNLTKIPEGIFQLENLKVLILSMNRISDISQIVTAKFAGELIRLEAPENQIGSIPNEISSLKKLEILNLSCNNLRSIPDSIGELVELKVLNVSINNLETIPHAISRLRNIEIFSFLFNPIEYIPPSVARLIRRTISGEKTVYEDGQNVHNSEVQKSVAESLGKLLKEEPDIGIEKAIDEMMKSSLDEKAKKILLGYIRDKKEIHMICNVNFEETFVAVWHRIRRHLDKEEILKVLSQEILDSDGQCFTGKINRLVNSLNGFCRDVNIRIAENDQIAAVISAVRNQLENEGKYTKGKCRKLCREKLKELNVDEEKIEMWIKHIE